MCEPNHSIVQFPPQDDGGSRLGLTIGKVLDKMKKIRGWLHLSRMGAGHSGALRERTGTLPPYTSFEALWWARKVKVDGRYAIPEESQFALENAVLYAQRVSIGSLPILRQFLEQSILKTHHPMMYVHQFMDNMVEPRFRDQVISRVRRSDSRKNIIAALCWATRQRNLLWGPWADDPIVWTSDNGMLTS